MLKRLILSVLIIFLLTVSVIALDRNPAEPVGVPYFEQLVSDSLSQFGLPETESATEPETEPELIEEEPAPLELSFSHNGHFYNSDIKVAISASMPDAVIYYTTDGSEPTVESDIYTEPLIFKAKNKVRGKGAYPLKAIAVYNDITTRPLVHTYFVAKDINDAFDVMVISLSTDYDYLFDYETGILVEGITRREYINENPGVRIDPPAPANYNWRGRESERPIYVEMFLPDGERVISQAAGVRTHGGWSRAANQKSLRLIARREYEPTDGKFKYDFFPEDVSAAGNNLPIKSYDQIVLSNNANDREFGMLRQEVNYALARSAGIRTVPSARAAAIFLNGEYYGFTWINTGMNEQYLEDLYSAPERSFQIVGNGEEWIETEDEAEIEAIEYLNSFYYKDFTDPDVLAEFESLVDLDNLLLYYAYQTFAGNRDWPNNNLKRWRYTGYINPDTDDIPALAPELDGRWRYIMYDMDFLMSLYENSVRAGSPSFTEYLSKRSERYSYMLAALFENSSIVDRYALYICDIAANIVTAENVEEQIERLYTEAYSEIGYALSNGRYSNWVSRNSIEDNHANMIKYTERRAGLFFIDMCDYFNWGYDMFSVEVSGAPAVIGTQSAVSSRYFEHLSVPVRPDMFMADKYIVFDYWLLNGVPVYTEEIIVTADDAIDGVVRLELHMKEQLPALQLKNPFVTENSEGLRHNGVSLYNTTPDYVRTEGLYLTDNLSNPYKWAIPAANVAAGELLDFAGKGSRDRSDIFKIQMGFNIKTGTTLYLCNEMSQVVDWIYVEP